MKISNSLTSSYSFDVMLSKTSLSPVLTTSKSPELALNIIIDRGGDLEGDLDNDFDMDLKNVLECEGRCCLSISIPPTGIQICRIVFRTTRQLTMIRSAVFPHTTGTSTIA